MTTIEITVEGNPPRKNERHAIRLRPKGPRCSKCHRSDVFPQRYNSSKFDAFTQALEIEWADQCLEPIDHGTWRLDVRTYWPRQRHIDGESFPFGDFDASISDIADALQYFEGGLDDDVRIMEGSLKKFHDKERPRIELTLTLLEEPAQTVLA